MKNLVSLLIILLSTDSRHAESVQRAINGDSSRAKRMVAAYLPQGRENRTSSFQHPYISGCDYAASNVCDVELRPNQDYLQLECSVYEVYPQPALTWSFSGCDGGATPTFFTAESSTNNSDSQTQNVTSVIYIVQLRSLLDVCRFVCTTHGDAIKNGSISSSLVITGLAMNSTQASQVIPVMKPGCPRCDCKWAIVVPLAMVMMLLFCLLVLGVILVFPRNRKCIRNHVDDFPTFPCLVGNEQVPEQEMTTTKQVTDAEENARNAQLDESQSRDEENDVEDTQGETSPMLTIENEESEVLETTRDRLCLVIRGVPDILITDRQHKWRSVGEFVTESALDDENISGFQAIRDVICTQDGGLVVIDASGLHNFTAAYHYRFMDLNEALGDENYCSVAYHCSSTNKLLLGLSRGKIVHFDLQNGQISNFSSVTRVKYADVQLSDISSDGLGFVFAGDRNGKAVSMFDEDGGCLTRMEIGIEPAFLCAHVRGESQSFFVSSGVSVKKYNIVRSDTNSKILAQIRFTIDRESLAGPKFHSGRVTVHGNKLLVVNHLEVGEKLEILEHDANRGTMQNSITVDVLGLRGVRFLEEDRIVVYTDEAVHLFERGGSP